MIDPRQRASLSATTRQLAPELPVYSAHLDFIRGCAALVVLLGHLRFMLEDLERSPQRAAVPLSTGHAASLLNTPPHEAVIVFFVLSGLLVGGSVLRSVNQHKFSWMSYTITRLSRLLTVLAPALLIGALIDLASRYLLAHGAVNYGRLQNVHFHASIRTLAANLFFLQVLDRTNIPAFGSNSVLWSLSAEFWYYALFPLLVFAVAATRARRRILFTLGFLVLSTLLWQNPLTRFHLWLLGACIAVLPLAVPPSLQRPFLAISMFQFFCVALVVWKHPFANRFLDDTLLGLSIAVLLYAVLHRRELRTKHLYAHVAEHLSRISFSLYLFHYPILLCLLLALATYAPSLTRHHAITFWLVAPVTYAVCYLLYLAFERNTSVVRRSMFALLRRDDQSQSALQGNQRTSAAA